MLRHFDRPLKRFTAALFTVAALALPSAFAEPAEESLCPPSDRVVVEAVEATTTLDENARRLLLDGITH
jgi:hypothetical protein